MLKVGITGGIGSGKSTVAKIFSSLDIPVFDADRAAKRLVLVDSTVRASIINHFGAESYINGQYNRQHIADIVFENKDKLNLLNSIIHPATIAYASNWFLKQRSSAYALKEAALIFESNGEKNLDFVIGVFAPLNIRIQRTMERDGLSEDQVMARIERQMNEDEKMKRCDFVIDNGGSSSVISQVLDTHINLTTLSHEKSRSNGERL